MAAIGLTQLLILIAMFGVPIFLALKFNKHYMSENPDAKSYRWGYFQASLNGINGVVIPIFSIVNGRFSFTGFFFELIFIIFALYIAGALYKRFMWPWVLYLLLIAGAFILSFFEMNGFVTLFVGIYFALNLFYVIGLNDELRPINEFKLRFWEL